MTFSFLVPGHAPGGMKRCRSVVQIFIPVFACLLTSAVSLVAAGPANAENSDFDDFLEDGSIILDARARIEVADDSDRSLEKGRAFTLRARVGFETGEYRHFKALVEGEFVQRAGLVTFNDTVNGKTGFAVIADPNVAQLNRAQLTYTGIPDTTIIAGRQRIILDNGRFVGNDGFRQNEQTFDALRIINNSFADTTLSYTFIGGVNRVFGGESPVGRFTGQTHLIRATYAGLPVGTITGYTYLLDFNQAPDLSTKTFGARLVSIRQPWGNVRINYGFEFATQRSYADNPRDFDLGYIMGEVGVAFDGAREAVSLNAKIEWLDGGTFRGFSTPLASLHQFQGFADKLTTIPGTGVEDAQIVVDYDMKALNFAKNIRISVWYHKYSLITGNGSLGREVNLAAIADFNDRLTLTVKYADFNATDGGPVRDGEILWAMLGFKY